MTTFSLNTAATAMATALGSVTPPSGDTMRKAYGQAPNNVPSLPAAVVLPKSGTFDPPGSGLLAGHHLVDVLLLIEKASADFARIEARRQKWVPVIYHAFDSAMALGLAPVVLKTYATGYEFVEYNYAGVSYDGVLFHFQIDTRETVSFAP